MSHECSGVEDAVTQEYIKRLEAQVAELKRDLASAEGEIAHMKDDPDYKKITAERDALRYVNTIEKPEVGVFERMFRLLFKRPQ